MTVEITNRLNKFNAAISSVLKDKLFGFERVYVLVLLSKCLPILLFYGLYSMVIYSSIVQIVTKTRNMKFRWIFGLRKFDLTRLLLQSCGNISAKFLLHKHFLLFYNSIYSSNLCDLHNLWVWYWCKNSVRCLVFDYDLIDVSDRKLICYALSQPFNSYCDVTVSKLYFYLFLFIYCIIMFGLKANKAYYYYYYSELLTRSS